MSEFKESCTIVDVEPPIQIISEENDDLNDDNYEDSEEHHRFKYIKHHGEEEEEEEQQEEYEYNEEEEIKKEEEDNLILFENGMVKMPLKQYKQLIYPIINEYFVSNDVDELINSLEEINEPHYIYEFIEKLITISLDYNNKEKELVSTLLSNFYPDIFSMYNISKAFEILIKKMKRIQLDFPNIEEILIKYISRCIVDEVLSPSFLLDPNIIKLNRSLNKKIRNFLTQKFIIKKCENIWNVENNPENLNNLSHINKIIDNYYIEYFLINDVNDLVANIKELNMVYYLHEIVKRGIVIAISRNYRKSNLINKNNKSESTDSIPTSTNANEGEIHLLIEFFKRLTTENYLTEYQLKKGLEKVLDKLNDMVLDSPYCKEIFVILLKKLKSEKILEQEDLFQEQENEIINQFLKKYNEHHKLRDENFDENSYNEEELIYLDLLPYVKKD